MEGQFHTVCHTCSKEYYSETWDHADHFYWEHAGRRHAVELLNLEA